MTEKQNFTFYLTLINLNVTGLVWLVATVLHHAAPDEGSVKGQRVHTSDSAGHMVSVAITQR